MFFMCALKCKVWVCFWNKTHSASPFNCDKSMFSNCHHQPLMNVRVYQFILINFLISRRCRRRTAHIISSNRCRRDIKYFQLFFLSRWGQTTEQKNEKFDFVINFSLCWLKINIFFFFLQFQAAAGLDLKENLAGSPWPYPPVYPGYDAALAGYHFNG